MQPKDILLARPPRDVLKRIEPDLTVVSLPCGKIIHKSGEQIGELYVPITCLISITALMADGRTMEIVAIGSREVAGINAFLGGRATAQTKYTVQLPGEAIRMETRKLKTEFSRNNEMCAVMLRYTQTLAVNRGRGVSVSRSITTNTPHHRS
jgi:hypothetical protein